MSARADAASAALRSVSTQSTIGVLDAHAERAPVS